MAAATRVCTGGGFPTNKMAAAFGVTTIGATAASPPLQ